MYKVLETRDEEDLSSLRDYLFSLNMEHRISESGGRQILWVYRLEDAEIVIRAYEQFKTFPKASQTRLTSLALIAGPSRGLLAFIRTAPVTSLLVLSSLLIFILTSEDEVLPTNHSALIGNLFFSPVTRVENQFFFVPLEQVLLSGEWWRLITPMFVH
ncbi:MAG: rhomboid protease N-terminal domain-containing protein, partial [Pseudomonadota bacterium]|nr:rhomboid protease N-terminal domain-containing protein [Pseudomonadota bacterium]